MAGIGFALERMAAGRSIAGISGAYLHSTFLATGPWVFTALAMAGLSAAVDSAGSSGVEEFRSVLIYNFLFSLVLTGPIVLPATRFISDEIYARRYDAISSALATAFIIFLGLGFVVVGPVIAFTGNFAWPVKLAAFQNFLLIGAVWLIAPFLGATNSYRTVSLAFLAALIVILALAMLAPDEGPFALLNIFNAGLGVALATLAVAFARAHGLSFHFAPRLLAPYSRYWELPAIGLAYNFGIWIDKLVLWSAAPRSVTHAAGALTTMPDYDSVMFWAQLTAIPAMAIFFVNLEPGFYRLYRRFYLSFDAKVTQREARVRMEQLGAYTLRGLLAMLVTGLVVAGGAILASYSAIEHLGLRANQAGMLRTALIGVAFQTCVMFCLCFLLYFDLRRHALLVAGGFLLLNGGLTYALLPLGPVFYGYGYMLAAIVTFFAAFALLARELPWLHFHAFVTNNATPRNLSGRTGV